MLSRDGREQPFFLEWERRTIRPSTMAAKLAPYLRYYSSRRPLEDHGAIPLILVAFEDELAPDHFLSVARDETNGAGCELPLFVSARGLLRRYGPLGPAWRSADDSGAFAALA